NGNSTGIFVADGSNIAITSNVIGNSSYGIKAVSVTNLTIKNNNIGIGAGGQLIGGLSAAISLTQTSSATIGDLTGGANTIASSNVGIEILTSGTGNSIRGNSMFNNAFGIDLGAGGFSNGQTPNDPGDGDSGPNNLQNYPVLTRATSIGGSTTILGTFNSVPGQSFTIDFYWNDSTCSATGQGKTDHA